MSTNNIITVALIDDSSVIRGALTRIIETDKNIKVIASLANGEMAVSCAKNHKPDVMVLDIEMPIMDGLTALPQIIKHSPDTKVIMFSALTNEGADATIKAMALGAVECIVKPKSSQDTSPGSEFHTYITSLIKTLGGAKPANNLTSNIKSEENKSYNVAPKVNSSQSFQPPEILAVGSSTGGPQALFNFFKGLGAIDVPVIITQHMPATFTKILAEHITQKSEMPAYEGEDGMVIEKGKIYVAPGGKHMTFKRQDGQTVIKLDDGVPENFCKPAVDVMMRSIIDIHQNKILCVILTGMGHDGLVGARQLHKLGGRIIAQDKKTSVVWGMPGAVAEDGICNEVLPIDDIGQKVKQIIG